VKTQNLNFPIRQEQENINKQRLRIGEIMGSAVCLQWQLEREKLSHH
jgi:hypothetical protein